MLNTRISKQAINEERFTRPYSMHKNARSAFKSFLGTVCPKGDEVVLLPAYIGWSSKEGSGVFDPVQELGLPYAFYRLDDRLRIDLAHLESTLRGGRVRVMVIIHYFGYVDPGYERAVELARRYGAFVLEDEAHAMFTDLIGGCSGRLGDACIFSLHKMLPVKDGGMLLWNVGLSGLPDCSLFPAMAIRPLCDRPSETRKCRTADQASEAAKRKNRAALGEPAPW